MTTKDTFILTGEVIPEGARVLYRKIQTATIFFDNNHVGQASTIKPQTDLADIPEPTKHIVIETVLITGYKNDMTGEVDSTHQTISAIQLPVSYLLK